MARPGAVLLLLVALVAACGQGTSTSGASAGSSAGASVEASASSTDGSPESSAQSAGTGQTATDWGPIWDGLPAAFPVYPGATPADEAQVGPASGTFAVAGGDARGIAGWMQVELERAAFRTEGLNGPMEDGGFILESTGSGECRIQVEVKPLGGMSIVSVRYGAACPAP